MSLLRQAARRSWPGFMISRQRPIRSRPTCISFFATKPNFKGKSQNVQPSSEASTTLIPRSLRIIDSPAARAEYILAQSKMQVSVDWYRKECANLAIRASGRVTPALLPPVSVSLPDQVESVRLEEVATVGVRDGSSLWIVAFEERNLKHIETALYDAKIPTIVPQRVDSRTIKIPIPRPTVEACKSLYTAAHRQSEDIRVQIRKIHQASIKRGKYAKHSLEFTVFQTLEKNWIAEVDKILADLKKATGAMK